MNLVRHQQIAVSKQPLIPGTIELSLVASVAGAALDDVGAGGMSPEHHPSRLAMAWDQTDLDGATCATFLARKIRISRLSPS